MRDRDDIPPASKNWNIIQVEELQKLNYFNGIKAPTTETRKF